MAAAPIDIFPGTPITLVQAIKDANEQNRTISVHAGTYYTMPGRGIHIKLKSVQTDCGSKALALW